MSWSDSESEGTVNNGLLFSLVNAVFNPGIFRPLFFDKYLMVYSWTSNLLIPLGLISSFCFLATQIDWGKPTFLVRKIMNNTVSFFFVIISLVMYFLYAIAYSGTIDFRQKSIISILLIIGLYMSNSGFRKINKNKFLFYILGANSMLLLASLYSIK